AIRMVLESNNSIAVSRIGREISKFGVSGATGAFDPVFGVRSSVYRQVTPVSSTLGGSATGAVDSRAVSIQPQISGLLPWNGTAYQASFSSARQTSDNAFTTLNPQFPSSLSITVTQPLGRNFKFDPARQGLAVSRKNETLTFEQLRQLLSDSVTQTVEAYADLVYANEFLKVEVDAVGLARNQVNSNQRMVDQGVSAPVDVIEARTQLATFEQAVYAAQAQLTRAENNLKSLILANRNDPLWNSSLRPATDLNLNAPSITLSDAVRDAISSRPEMTQVEISAEINSLNSRLYREQTKPQIDLVAGYTAAGLGGRPVTSVNPLTTGFNPIVDRLNELSNASGLPPLASSGIGSGGVPPQFIGGAGQSLSNLFNGSYPTAQVGVNISLPLRNRTAEANLSSSLAEGRKIQLQKDNLEQLIQSDVRSSMQAVDSSRLRLRAAVDTRNFAEQQYESEQRKFQSGTSTVFLVLDRQQALVRSRILELQAQTDLNKAIAELDRATARTFSIHNITVK
ncbi:MAG TPA: TolC family protein, partial [Terriglobia bacterium]|nr:TolC family protein [Terriglobia bacterium]